MSDYVREKVVRLPVDAERLTQFYKVDSLGDLEDVPELKELFDWKRNFDKFQASSTGEDYIDYVLDYSYGVEYGEWGRNRELTETEKDKYEEWFKNVVPWVERDKLRLVEYCWYDACEAPDYYDANDDEFDKEI